MKMHAVRKEKKTTTQPAKIMPAVTSKDKDEIKRVVALPNTHKKVVINSAESCQQAADILRDAKAKVKELDTRRKTITRPLDQAKKATMDLFRPAMEALTALEDIIKPKIAQYTEAQEAARRKAEAEAEEKARKVRERLEARADKAMEAGRTEQAEALELQAASTVSVAPVHTTPKVAGVSVRKAWVAEVTDIVALCKAIAEGLIPPTVIETKQAELNRLASTWQNNRTFPGLKIHQKSVVASRCRDSHAQAQEPTPF